MISEAIIIPIVSALLAAIANILARVLSKNIPAKKILAVNFFTMGATLLVLSPLFYKFIFTWQSIGLVVLIAIIDTFANYFYFKTLEATEASVAIPILSLAPIATFLLSALFLKEYPAPLSIMGALTIMGLIIFVSSNWKERPKFSAATLYPALASSFLFGVSAVPSKYLLSQLETTNAPTLYMIRAGLIGLFSLLIYRNSLNAFDIKTYGFIFVRGLFAIGQWVLLYYALTLGSTGVAMTLGNITPVFVLFLSILLLRESFNWRKVLAAIAVLALSLTL